MIGRRTGTMPIAARSRDFAAPTSSRLLGFALGIELLLATALDYLWLGPLPAWLWWLGGIGLTIAFSTRLQLALRTVLTNRWIGRIIVLWLAYVGFAVLSDLLNGGLSGSYRDTIFLNLSVLALFLVMGAASMLVTPRVVVTYLAILAGIQGLVAVLQFAGVEKAWTLADRIASLSSRLVTVDSGETMAIGRVRGISMFVHKFNATQGVLVAWLLVVAQGISAIPSNRFFRVFVVGITILGAIAVFMTYSRSSMLGLGAVFVVALVAISSGRMQFRLLLVVAVMAGLLFGVIGFSSHREFSRLLMYAEPERQQGYALAIEAGMRSPLIGEGTFVDISSLEVAIHSVPLRTLGSYGLLGVFAYLGVLWAFWGLFWTTARLPGRLARVFGIAGIGALLVVMIDSATHTSGLLHNDVAQPALLGVFAGQCLRLRLLLRGADRE
jgi:hypothetical protein